MILTSLSIISLPLTAVCYFYSRTWPCIIAALLFFVSNIMLTHNLIYYDHVFIFSIIMAICVVFPVSCMIAFALDIKYGLFCIDTTFSMIIAWFFSPILVPINLFILCLGN